MLPLTLAQSFCLSGSGRKMNDANIFGDDSAHEKSPTKMAVLFE
jgi:hypothetical protein